jgi:GrpB-like predicted nucleotidyltransferase (UPF0157 family)
MTTDTKIEICDWSPASRKKFRDKATTIRNALGSSALRIDHIGSTSIEGLAGKPVIDIQVSVADFEPVDQLVQAMEVAGYLWRPQNPDLGKRYFRETPGAERTHIHVRRAGSFHEQWALLFRDYMRRHAEEHGPYAALKIELAERHRSDRAAYTAGKEEHIWAIIRRANRWASATGWLPGPSDA